MTYFNLGIFIFQEIQVILIQSFAGNPVVGDNRKESNIYICHRIHCLTRFIQFWELITSLNLLKFNTNHIIVTFLLYHIKCDYLFLFERLKCSLLIDLFSKLRSNKKALTILYTKNWAITRCYGLISIF